MKQFFFVCLIIFISTNLFANSQHIASKDPAEMVVIAAGYFPFQDKQWLYLPAFLMDKYEVTNQSYCRFLNDSDPNGEHYNIAMQIDRRGSVGSYRYTPKPGMENAPVCYANFYDACAYARWRSKTYGGSYHVPTEPQWEKAALWNPVRPHCCFYGFHFNSFFCTLCDYSAMFFTAPPEWDIPISFRRGAQSYYGCCDMICNRWEWTSSNNGPAHKYLRSGEWRYFATRRVGYRTYVTPDSRFEPVRFRLVRELP